MRYFIINFKTYPQASGEAAVNLAKQLNDVDLPEDVELVICPQAADIYRIREALPEIHIWAQHIDLIEPGRATGWTSIETMLMAGITGTLINHSEHSLSYEETIGTIQLAKEHEIASCVAVTDSLMAQKLVESKPDVIAFEPPELVGSGVSLMEADPAEAQEFFSKLNDSESELAIGAGVSDKNDVRKGLEIGFTGVLVASAIVKAQNPAEKLSEMLEPFRNA